MIKFPFLLKITGLISVYSLLTVKVYASDEPPLKTNNLTLIVFLSIVTVGLFIALLLTYFAKQTTQIKENKINKPNQPSDSDIIQKIDKLTSSEPRKKETVKKISNFFQEELQKRVDMATQEVSKKYESVIKEQNQTIEIAQQKYTRVASDKKQTESIIRSIAEGLVVVNNKGEILLMNPVAKELLGVKGKDKSKTNLKNLGDEYLLSLKDSSKEKQEIVVQSSKDDTKKVLRTSNAVIENENGKTVGMVSVLSDITKQRELEKMKSDFVSSVSHELRTPLISIQKSVDLMLSKAAGPLTKEQENFLNISQNNLERLTHLINDILDLSKVESKKMKLELKPTRAEKVINDACESLKSWADSKSIKIDKIIADNLPDIDMDSLRIIQVLNNLIGNAIKFTPQNGLITVKAQLTQQKDNIEISVSDNGIGIEGKNLDKVFDKFQQVDNRVATDISGTGLGLFITKELIALHGGEIWVESKKDEGTKFTFTIPLKNKTIN